MKKHNSRKALLRQSGACNTRVKALCGVVALLAFCSQSALAGSLSVLGVGVQLYSSDGAGNFQLQVDEYMSPYGPVWLENFGGAAIWDATYSGPNLAISLTGATVTGPMSGATGAVLSYQGIVNETNTAFYNVPSTTWAVNIDSYGDTTDSAKYSAILNYSIAGFNPSQSYSLTATVDDCCVDVAPPDLPHASAQVSFNPSQVLTPVPEPGAVWMMGAGLLVLIARARKQRA